MNLDPDDFSSAPFTQRGGLHGLRSLGEGGGNLSAIALATAEAYQPALRSFSEVGLFGEQLPKLLTCLAIALGRRRNELNEVLAA